MKLIAAAFGVLMMCGSANAAPLDDIAFLTGDWHGAGKSENATTDKGTSHIHPVVGGHALLRQDHTDVTDAGGKIVESFDQIMLIYPEGGTLHADYLDGAHVIHYTAAAIDPGKSVQFSTAPATGGPAFRLTYTRDGADGLDILFEMQLPGVPAFQTVAKGAVKRD